MLQKNKINKSFVHEIEIIYSNQTPFKDVYIKSVNEAYEFLKLIYDFRKVDYKEFFFVVLLNKQNQVLGYSQIGIGSTSGVAVNLKEIFQLALMSNASGIILSHNHPSGCLNPSESDKTLTQNVKMGCQYFDISMIDHIIFTSHGYFSFSDDGLI